MVIFSASHRYFGREVVLHDCAEIAQHFVFDLTCDVIDEREVNETCFHLQIYLGYLMPLQIYNLAR